MTASSRLALLLLPLVALLAHQLRDRDYTGPVVDPGSAGHLRIMELTLARQAAPARDRFLAPPELTGLADSPLFDSAVAGLAQMVLADHARGPALGGVTEAELESFALAVGPGLGMVTLIALFFAVQVGARGAHRAWAGLLAAGMFAIGPSAVEVGTAGTFDRGTLHALFAALVLTTSSQLARSEQGADLLQGGLTAGLAIGAALICGPQGLILVPFAWGAGWIAARSASDRVGEGAAIARQAGLFLALVAAIVLTLAGSQLGDDGLGARWLKGSSELAFLGGIPFLLPRLLGLARARAKVRLGLMVMLVASLVILPLSLGNLGSALRPRWIDAAASADPLSAFMRTPVLWLAPWLVPHAALLARRTGNRLLGLAGFVAGLASLATLLDPSAASTLAVVVAFLAGLVVSELVREARGSTALLAGAFSVALPGACLLSVPSRPAGSGVAPEVVEALRWTRDETPSSGPWNSAESLQDYSVLAPVYWGPLVAYHARRPPFATGTGLLEDRERVAEAMRAYLSSTARELAEFMGARGIRYVLAGGEVIEEWEAISRVGGGPGDVAGSTLWRLTTLAPEGSEEADYFSLERVFGTTEIILDGEGYTVPRVALYRLDPPVTDGGDAPQLRSR